MEAAFTVESYMYTKHAYMGPSCIIPVLTAARFIVTGHTHRRGIWPRADGRVVINTGSYTLPLDPAAVDVSDRNVTVREIVLRSGEFRFGRTLATFPLAAPANAAEKTET